MFVYRDFVTNYKQTILGPLWFILQPVLFALMNLFIFGSVAKIGPTGIPGFLFFLSGPILWQYFQDGFLKISSVFIENQQIFGKVYFPRLIVPITILISGLLKFSVQFILLIGVIVYYYLDQGYLVLNANLLYLPLLLINIMLITLGFGLIVSSLTAKYRDFKFFFDFFIPLLKYITPGIATTYLIFIETLPEYLHPIAKLNPLGYIIDMFNHIMVGAGSLNWNGFLYSLGVGVVAVIIGATLFNQTEKNFMDTV